MSPLIMESSEVFPSSNNGIVKLDVRGSTATLNLSGCSNLEKLPPLYGLCYLTELFLDGTALVEISPDIVSLSSLELLSLSDTPIEELPSSIGCLSSLLVLYLERCKKLRSLPNSICELKCLGALLLSGCSNLEKLPPLYGLCYLKELFLDGTALVEISPDIVSLSSLELLSLSYTPMEELPSSIGCLSSLVSLYLQRCKKLKSLPNSICKLKCLETLHLRGCSNLEKLPPLHGLCSLRDLYLDGTALVKIPLDIFSLSSLGVLFLNDIPIEELPSSIGYELNFCNCVNLDQNARGTIMADAIQRIKELAIARSYGAFYPRFLIGLPGSKIPEWLSCEGPGHLIETSFPPDWLKQNCDMENKATFRLYPEHMCSDHMRKWEVKRFGFHLLYDKVELNKYGEANFLEQFKETTNADNKRSREDFYSSDINGNQEVETHPKRLRQNFFMEDYFSNAEDGINYDAAMVPSSSSCEFAPKFYKFL
ncbi:hypothetical protein GH714_018557 [Hevea brasiliensis]|uniref:Disease resistance R13L4/SHOC-2-like LRR domain-containing protein n=1 Tax=Hevea brasiliensis TaxID=3981 RepID=A0A6A6L9A3_HEVBR|nr:hypothetical protein GH714_018557 [Hevea brasiliensis]